MNKVEGQMDEATSDNLKLKGLNFDLDYKINHYSIVIEQV